MWKSYQQSEHSSAYASPSSKIWHHFRIKHCNTSHKSLHFGAEWPCCRWELVQSSHQRNPVQHVLSFCMLSLPVNFLQAYICAKEYNQREVLYLNTCLFRAFTRISEVLSPRLTPKHLKSQMFNFDPRYDLSLSYTCDRWKFSRSKPNGFKYKFSRIMRSAVSCVIKKSQRTLRSRSNIRMRPDWRVSILLFHHHQPPLTFNEAGEYNRGDEWIEKRKLATLRRRSLNRESKPKVNFVHVTVRKIVSAMKEPLKSHMHKFAAYFSTALLSCEHTFFLSNFGQTF